MALTVSFDLGGLDTYCEVTSRALQNFGPKLQEITWLWGAKRVSDNFQRQQFPWGEPWPPLSPWAEWNRKRNKDPGKIKILQDTGTLMNSLINAGYEQSACIIEGNSRVVYGTPVKYANIHEFGGTVGEHRIPPRSFMPTTEQNARDWQEMVADAILRDLGRK